MNGEPAHLWLRAFGWVEPRRLLVATVAAGLLTLCLMTALAAAVYDAVSESDGVAGIDQPALRAARSLRTPLLDRLVSAYSALGGTVWLPVLATVAAVVLSIVWRSWTPIYLTAMTGTGSLLLTTVGKAVVARPRPPSIDAVPPYETSYSFPSGHSLNSLALAGIIGYLVMLKLRARWARTLTASMCAAFGVSIGLSRVYLGHHWLTDVLVAWLLALAWLTLVITTHRMFLVVRERRRL